MAALISNIGSYVELGDKHHALVGLPLGKDLRYFNTC
jgi:hypothetical protein